ncbi:MAG TPA: hybrid sensor histidine kinase/response regulator, partial [Myxococcota bacterium]|nr:hybrid sensor histidine kinase/response regulator [Myxococcota bacterium]
MSRPMERILNVDDTDASRYVKSRILRLAGYEVLEAATGNEALAIVRERMPDLVLLDVKLPDISGLEVCARVKAEPATARVVILQTSASHVELRHRVQSLDAGADGYLVEPMEPEELLANVRALLRMRRAEQGLAAALEALREADRRKDEFLAMLAHELRNPLAPIRNAVEILKSPDSALRERARALIGRQVDHLARLVDDLLDVSRITRRRITLKRRLLDVREAVQQAVEACRGLAVQKGLHLDLVLPDTPLVVDGDPVRLEQMIGNLLGNAIKYTPAGGSLHVAARAEDNSAVIVVRDSGVGIAPDHLPHVFDLFAQATGTL